MPTTAGVPPQLPVNALQAAIVGGEPFPQGNIAQPRPQYHTPPGITYGANPFRPPYPPMNHAFTNAARALRPPNANANAARALRSPNAIGNIPIAHPLEGRVSFHHGVGGNISLQQEFFPLPNPNPNPSPPLPYPNMPSLPPLNINSPAQNSLPRPPLIGTWICCNIEYARQKRRCGKCKKWKGGKRAPYNNKKKSEGTNAPSSIQAPTGEANSNGTGVARARPALEVNVTPTGARQSTMSPMTGGESLGDSTAATITTNNSVIETNELLQRMITSDLNGQGDGGDSEA